MEKVRDIRPAGPTSIMMWVFGMLFPVIMLVLAILVLVIEGSVLGFFLGMLMNLFLWTYCLRIFLWRVSFIGNRIHARKTSAQVEELNVECSKILKCDVRYYDILHFGFIFDCVDKKKRGLSLTLFSKKQRRRILEMIKERGGLQEQDNFDELVEKSDINNVGKKQPKQKNKVLSNQNFNDRQSQ